jgi:hypothetical protein
MALDVVLGASLTRIYDRNRARVGAYDVVVGQAYRRMPVPELCPEPESVHVLWTALPPA